MGFARARELVPYLRDLGVSHLYLSPALQARSGSTHGYDVTDPRRISEDLTGGAQPEGDQPRSSASIARPPHATHSTSKGGPESPGLGEPSPAAARRTMHPGGRDTIGG
jgi:hypothetical protein